MVILARMVKGSSLLFGLFFLASCANKVRVHTPAPLFMTAEATGKSLGGVGSTAKLGSSGVPSGNCGSRIMSGDGGAGGAVGPLSLS